MSEVKKPDTPMPVVTSGKAVVFKMRQVKSHAKKRYTLGAAAVAVLVIALLVYCFYSKDAA